MRSVLLTLLALGISCKGNELVLDKVPIKMDVSPILTDLQTIYVGEEVMSIIEVTSLQGETLEISSFELVNTEGTYFSYDGESAFNVESKDVHEAAISYLPEDAGYHICEIAVLSNSIEGEALVSIRAQAIWPKAERWPDVIDFGNVGAGQSQTGTVTVFNNNSIDVTLNELQFSSGDFSVQSTLPIVIPAGFEEEVTISFDSTSSDVLNATASFVFVENIVLDAVNLRANDCENGQSELYDLDGDGFATCGGDCDDSDDAINPNAIETCDQIDNDCDGIIDEGTSCFDDDGDGVTEDEGDCNDADPNVNPNMTEVDQNSIDDDCDGTIDLGVVDNDLDGYTSDGGDCDDDEYTVYPFAPELPDGLDNDCDGTIDEGTANVDDDGDGYAEIDGDCNDYVAATYPNAPELPDWQDNDCDGTVDEGTENYDDDGDGYSEIGGDTDDNDPNVHP